MSAPILALVATLTLPQVPVPNAPATGRENTWPAPSAADWEQPCLVRFQRTWEDALAVAREEEKPILICVNMDGEIASEHYAGVRYRQADKARLYEPYVCVVASVFRHTPRDYDEQGRRIPCPRFGSVTCGEHIAIEPILFEQFMDGRRIAPRHIGVDLRAGKSELYDVFYRFDTASVFADIEKAAADYPPPRPRGDRTESARLASRAAEDREAVERAFLSGDRATRRRLLTETLTHQELAPLDLLRLALFGLDAELARLARAALAEAREEAAVDLIVEVLRAPLDAGERATLEAALERLSLEFPRARTLVAVQEGMSRPSERVSVEAWRSALAGGEYPAPHTFLALEERLASRAEAGRARPSDAEAQLELAEAALELALDPSTRRILAADYRTASDYARLHLEDALRSAQAAERLGAEGWRLEAVSALASYYLGDLEVARARAEKAVRALPSGEASFQALGVLALFAQARQRAVEDALSRQSEWPAEWLADVNATYAVLEAHPLTADHFFGTHHDFLKRLGARARAAEVLEAGLARFPDSWGLHERLRLQCLEERGVEGLERAYAERLAAQPRAQAIEWFAGYAALVTAEYYRRAGNPAAAGAAYQSAVELYEASIQADEASRVSSDHYVSMALAGRARLALEGRDHASAVRDLCASFERCPGAAASADGLNLTAVDTAKMLLARLEEGRETDLAEKLRAALARLDPAQLELPAYERELPPPARGQDARSGR